jgi:hypothetical protein
MIRAVVVEHLNAPPDTVRAVYDRPENWRHVFPRTIRLARVLRRARDATVVEVQHVEGRVINVLRHVSPSRIDLVEFKRRYNAAFRNEFLSEGNGTLYRLTAYVDLKWPWRLLSPVLAPLVRSRMRRYVVVPLKRTVEASR